MLIKIYYRAEFARHVHNAFACEGEKMGSGHNLLLWPYEQVAQDDILDIIACVACCNAIPPRDSAQGHIQLAMCEWV